MIQPGNLTPPSHHLFPSSTSELSERCLSSAADLGHGSVAIFLALKHSQISNGDEEGGGGGGTS